MKKLLMFLLILIFVTGLLSADVSYDTRLVRGYEELNQFNWLGVTSFELENLSPERLSQFSMRSGTTFWIEDFDDSNELPDGWDADYTAPSGAIVIVEGAGVGGTNAVRMMKRKHGSISLTSPSIGPIPTGARLRFHYRAWEDWGGAIAMNRIGRLDIKVDGEIISTIDGDNHTPAGANYIQFIEAYLGDFATQEIRIEFVWTYLGNPQWPDICFFAFDNFEVFVPENYDMQAISIKGSLGPGAMIEHIYTVKVRNVGLSTASGYSMRIMRVGYDTPLAYVEGIEVESFEFQEIIIPWVPTIEGEMKIYGHIEWAEDQYKYNNSTQELNITVHPEGFVEVPVGD